MYNRYIPQPDGTFRRSQIPDQAPKPAPTRPQPQQPSKPEEPQECQPPQSAQYQQDCRNPVNPRSCAKQGSHNQRRCTRPAPPPRQENCRDSSVGSFLRSLLPKEFDTSDLLIVILLLLMAGDCQEDQNTALLTLVIYLFL